MHGGRGASAMFLHHRDLILSKYGDLLFDSTVEEVEKKERMKVITTAYDMGAGLDFWKKEMGEGRRVETAKGTCLHFLNEQGTLVSFSLERYHAELKRSAEWMAGKSSSMLEYLSQKGWSPKKGKHEWEGKGALTLKSYLLQEAEAVSREAKLLCLAQYEADIRAVSLQHDGVAVTGFAEEAFPYMEGELSHWASTAAGYPVTVVGKAVAEQIIVA